MSRTTCARCRHPRPLHSKGAACQAKGCKAGTDGKPCEYFTDVMPAVTPAVPAVVFQAPDTALPIAG